MRDKDRNEEARGVAVFRQAVVAWKRIVATER